MNDLFPNRRGQIASQARKWRSKKLALQNDINDAIAADDEGKAQDLMAELDTVVTHIKRLERHV